MISGNSTTLLPLDVPVASPAWVLRFFSTVGGSSSSGDRDLFFDEHFLMSVEVEGDDDTTILEGQEEPVAVVVAMAAKRLFSTGGGRS